MGILNLQPPIGSAGTSPYGALRNGGEHKGIDYEAELPTEVRASETGRVVRAAENPVDRTEDPKTGKQRRPRAYGNVIVIDHTPFADKAKRHIYTLYAHLSSMGVAAGQCVEKEDPIGETGATGTVTGPHLHFEVIDSPVKLHWLSARGAMGVGGIVGRRNPKDLLRKDIEVDGTALDGTRKAVRDGVKQRLEYVPDIDFKRRNAFRIVVWLDGKIIGYFDKENSTIRLHYSYDVGEELRKLLA